ncbi:MAG: hypothetical protein ACI8Z1_001271 [Candidatus Azotimanducaceae bacterium]|jgi:hypothetical protein
MTRSRNKERADRQAIPETLNKRIGGSQGSKGIVDDMQIITFEEIAT